MKWTVCEKSCWLADNPLAIAECAALRISVSGRPDRTATWSQAATDNNESAALGRGWCRRAQGRQDRGGRHARSRPERCCWGENRIHGHQRRQERRQRRQDPC